MLCFDRSSGSTPTLIAAAAVSHGRLARVGMCVTCPYDQGSPCPGRGDKC